MKEIDQYRQYHYKPIPFSKSEIESAIALTKHRIAELSRAYPNVISHLSTQDQEHVRQLHALVYDLTALLARATPTIEEFEKQQTLVITNWEKSYNLIEPIVKHVLQNQKLETIIAVAPYFSEYFIRTLENTTVRQVLLVLDKNPPPYTLKAIETLAQNAAVRKIRVIVKQRPAKSRFMHLKCLIPVFGLMNLQTNTNESKPMCSFVGSLNWTRGGVKDNDEMLVILRDANAISECWKKLDDLWKTSDIIYQS